MQPCSSTLFVDMQHKRHRADYDPLGRWHKSEVAEDIDAAEDIIARFERVPVQDQRAFAVYVLLQQEVRREGQNNASIAKVAGVSVWSLSGPMSVREQTNRGRGDAISSRQT